MRACRASVRAAMAGALAAATLMPAVFAAPVSSSSDERWAKPLTAVPGDAARGRALVADRQKGFCLLCHRAPIVEVRQQGDLAPSLAGAGTRWTVAELRARVADARAVDPQSIMPAYFRREGTRRVGTAWQGKTLFNAQDVEDVVAWLATLK